MYEVEHSNECFILTYINTIHEFFIQFSIAWIFIETYDTNKYIVWHNVYA